MNAPTADGSRLILRPTTGIRVLGWALAAFGLLFAYAGLSVGDEIDGVILMVTGGTFYALVGVSSVSARVVADSSGLRYRYFISRRIPKDQIVAVGIGPGSGPGYPTVAIIVQRRDRRPLRLTALQSWDTARTWWRLEDHVAALSEVLEVPRFDHLRSHGDERIRLMRLWYVFASGVGLIAIFGVVFGPGRDQTSWTTVAVLSVLALAPLTVFFSIARKPLHSEDHFALREEFRWKFFLGVRLASIPAVMGLMVLMSSPSLLPFLALVAISLVLLVLHAPTEANVRRADDHLRARQAPVLLSEALVDLDRGGS